MTFPIRENIRLTCLIAALAFGAFFHPAMAQDGPPAETIERLKQEEQRRIDERDGKVDAPIVVELFTTSDCSACVFADRMLYDTMNEKNVIALSCHIKDMSEMRQDEKDKGADASESYSGPMDPCVFRQWSYRPRRASDAMMSIPTFVINGQENVSGDDPRYYSDVLGRYQYQSKNKASHLFMEWKDNDTVSIHLPQRGEKDSINSASVWLIRYKDIEIEKVDHGINKGRVLRFSNIVQSIQHVGKWHGQMRTITVDVPPLQGGEERGGYVAMVQEMMGEPVIAAGRLIDYKTAADKDAAPVQTTPQRNAPAN